MPMRRPNLLDAFRRANDAPVPPAGGAGTGAPRAPAGGPASPQRAPVGGPVPAAPHSPVRPANVASARPAAAPARPEPEASAPRFEPPASVPVRPPRERLVLLALALAIAILALVFLLRDRSTGSTEEAVQAAGSAQPAGGVQTPAPAAQVPAPAPAPKPASSGAARTPHDDALYDARNRYTVRLIQYPNDKQGLALATEAYRWLVKFGYPVGSPILLGTGKGIVLCASAKPTSEELVPLRDNLRRLRYPESSKTMPFSTAYIDEIDDVLVR